ncbi:PREDICTED: DNA polymerase delta subunit 4 isoform X2 [Rhinopithecus bieti]|uniref:DNA polymerase delta subunit 4 isoform X2 n=1 Tax=Rhinopithecus bieti TaxID=61621 RepID=UPI000533313C|nr:PREDICTED: DNA polymerase delta subunit 4 isoform X2 [Rhinopithecus bieti]
MGWGRRPSLDPGDFLSRFVWVILSARRWPGPVCLSQQLSFSRPLAGLSSSPQSPPSLPAWVAAMGRKRLITDSYPVVKRREGPAGHSKGELAPELGEEPQPRDEEEAELELLRQFDLAWQYGPCTGITRLQRWCRAKQMGLEPPPEVWEVLKTHPGDPRFQCSLWHLYPL